MEPGGPHFIKVRMLRRVFPMHVLPVAAVIVRAIIALVALALVSSRASAQDTAELINLINAYRAAPQTCEGKRTDPAGMLVPNPILADARIPASGRLLDVLKARGYQAASAQAIDVSGPTNASGVMKFIAQRYCRQITSPQFSEIGVDRAGNDWHIILTRRLLSQDLGDWQSAGNEVLRLTNAARAEPRSCGSERFGAVPALDWNNKLAAAALAHSRDMAARSFLDHVGRGNSHASDRATRAGYAWQEIGENVASGHGSPQQVVSGWLSSPTHCANIMNGRFTEMGAAYVMNPKSDATIYWTQVFGTSR